MPTFTVPKNALAIGAGTLFYANLGTALPDYTVAGSVFTVNAWTGWNLLGITKSGHEFNYNIDTEDVDAAEYLDHLTTVTVGREAGMNFELLQVHATNMKRILNGGTLTTSGSGATLRSTYKPPQVGAEVRCMIGWQSTDDTERLVAQQAFQIGSLTVARNKGGAVGSLTAQFRFEPDANGDPYIHDFAGTVRG